MFDEPHPLLVFCLVGCALVVVLSFAKIALFWFVDWSLKCNILKKNMRKLIPPDEQVFLEKVGRFCGTIAVETFLSWINVLVILWQVATVTSNVLRDQLQSAPEAITS